MKHSEMDSVGSFFTTDGKDVWELESCFQTPSCTMVNLKTDARTTFGSGGITFESFRKLSQEK